MTTRLGLVRFGGTYGVIAFVLNTFKCSVLF